MCPILDGLSVDTALSTKPNPSIGEMSFGMSTSVSMGSGSHLDRVGGDRESSSNAPLAGSIASASASNKLEVQADISSNKRFSFSSHSETASATVSFSERSANYDDSSIRALAGSIAGYRDGAGSASAGVVTSLPLATSLTPVEVHADTLSGKSVTVPEDGISASGVKVAIGSATGSSRKSRVNEDSTALDMETPPGRCVSFKSTSSINGVSAAKSRSYELLSSYCEACHSSHRPCCPNFSPLASIALGATGASPNNGSMASASASSKTVIKESKKDKTSTLTESSRSRKTSVKSTTSDTSSACSSASRKHKNVSKKPSVTLSCSTSNTAEEQHSGLPTTTERAYLRAGSSASGASTSTTASSAVRSLLKFMKPREK